MAYKTNITPEKDTGWGVIYRLNDLFREIEQLSTIGKYDEWNFKLDRIFSNLCYREDMKIEEGKDGQIKSIEFDERAYRIKLFLDQEILKHKKQMRIAQKKIPIGRESDFHKDYISSKKLLYKAIFKKEIWLRKYMTELGLYLKEIESNPAGAMFGR
jgi:hypothetical protein